MNHKPQIDPIEVFPTVENMLYKLAWKYASTYPVSFEEARSEAYFGFMESCRKYQSDRGSSFSTWCYFCTYMHMKTWVTKRSKDPLTFVEGIAEEEAPLAAPQRSECLEMISGFSSDAQEILSLLLETPHELLGGVPLSAKKLLSAVKGYLMEQGKSRQALERAHEEIETHFRSAWAGN